MERYRTGLLILVPTATFVLLAGHASNAFGQTNSSSVPENTAAACQDRVDNDGDGFVDCQDQDCGMIVVCAGRRRGPAGLVFPPLRARERGQSRGRGLAVAGNVVGGIGILFMAAGVGVGLIPTDEMESDDGMWSGSIGLGLLGFVGMQVGNGLLLGGLRQCNRALRNNSLHYRRGSFIAGWILWGLTMASPALTIGLLEAEAPLSVAVATPLALGLTTFITTVVGWARASRQYRRDVTERPTSSVRITPYLSANGMGGIAGFAGTF